MKSTGGRDKFRVLVARFAVCSLDQLQNNDAFMACLRDYPEFASDCIREVGHGKVMEQDSLGYLKI